MDIDPMMLTTIDEMTSFGVEPSAPSPMVVAELMSTELITVSPESSLDEALHMMLREHVRHLLVLDNDRLRGVVCERDLSAYRTMARDVGPLTVAAVTHPPGCVCTPHTPLRVVARDMLARRCDVAVVLDSTRVVGIFTAADALRFLAS